jgi:hypothetical protein
LDSFIEDDSGMRYKTKITSFPLLRSENLNCFGPCEEIDVHTSGHRANRAVTPQFWGQRNFLLQEIVNGEEEVSTAVTLDVFFGRRPRVEPWLRHS